MRKRVQAKDRTISPHLDEKTSHYQRERIKSLHRFIKLPLLPHKYQFLNHSLSLSFHTHTLLHSPSTRVLMQALLALTYINQARTWSPAPRPPLGARCFQLLTPKRRGYRFVRWIKPRKRRLRISSLTHLTGSGKERRANGGNKLARQKWRS